MSRFIVRRLTAVLILAAVLCAAAPAAAAPAGRFPSPVVSGPGLVDQLLAWLGSLWLGHQPERRAPAAKGGTSSGSGYPGTDPLPGTDGHGMIDPNGLS